MEATPVDSEIRLPTLLSWDGKLTGLGITLLGKLTSRVDTARYTWPVRRIIFILLLAILPVQFSWAAVSAYCRHETGAAAKHFGHHEHQHQSQHQNQHKAGDDSSLKDKKAASSAQADKDCGSCQFSAAQPIPTAEPVIPAQSAEPQHLACEFIYGSHIPSGPERPDRDVSTPAVRFGGAVVIGAFLPA